MRLAVGLGRGGIRSRRPVHSTRAFFVVILITIVVGNLVWINPTSAQATEPFATAAVVPDDVLSYTVVPLRGNDDQWQQAVVLLERAGLGPALDELRADALGADNGGELPLDLFLGGEVAVVVTDVAVRLLIEESLEAPPTPGTPEPADSGPFVEIAETGFAVVLTAENPDFIELSIETAIADTASELDSEVQRLEHEGVAIEFVEVPSGSDSTPLAVARVDEFILVAGFPTDLEPLIETSAGERESLADLAAFDEVQAALDDPYLAFGFLNPLPSDSLRTTLGAAGLPVGIIGGQSSPGGFLVAADEPGLRIETVSLGSRDSGSPAATFPDSAVLAQTPSDVIVFFAASNLAGTGVLDAVGALLLSASGLAATNNQADSLEEMLEIQFEQVAQTIGVNLRSELLQQLTGEYGFWLELDQPTGAITALFSSGIDDPTAVAGALFQVTLLAQSAGSGEMTVASRPVTPDDRVFTVETGDPIVPLVEYGIVDDRLIVGLGDAVDNVEAAPESPLSESDRYQAIMSALPEATDGIFYVDLDRAIPLMTDVADQAGVDDVAAGLTGVENAEPADAMAIASPVSDANPDCSQFETQADAQASYDSFAAGSFQLDQDFDGEACENYFDQGDSPPATPVTVPTATSSTGTPVTEALTSTVTVDALSAFGMVAYEEDGNSRTSSLLLIAEPGE